MPDKFTKEKRSQIMSKIRSRGTKIELMLKAKLEENDIKFEYQPKMFGKPDFFIPPDTVVFCDSSFWHGRNWIRLKSQLPEGYWREHIGNNRRRDRVVTRKTRLEGYTVLRFWDSDIERKIDSCIDRILKASRQNSIVKV